MLNQKKLSTHLNEACKKTIEEFLHINDGINISKVSTSKRADEINGPSIEVTGKNFQYICLLEYESVDNDKILNLLTEKYPFVDEGEFPEIDVLDFFGEFLNILCGKINKELEKLDPNLNIEIPYFVYGLDSDYEKKFESLSCELSDFKFTIHYYIV